MTNPNRYVRKLSFQISKRQWDQIHQSADKEDMAISEFCRWALRLHLTRCEENQD